MAETVGTLFWEAVSDKRQYEAYLAANPGAKETGLNPGNTLDQLHRDALAMESQLTAAGYGDVATVLADGDAAAAAAWGAANAGELAQPFPTGQTNVLLSAGGSGGSGGSGTGVTTGVGSALSSAGSAAWGVLTGLVNDIQGFIQMLLNPGAWFSSAGAGIGTGAQAAGTGIASGASSVLSAAFWPVVILIAAVGVFLYGRRPRRRRA